MGTRAVHLVAMVGAVALLAATPVPAPVDEGIPLEQDDAGTGRDAGQTPQSAVHVERGGVYDATLVPATDLTGGLAGAAGDEDWFGFTGLAGEEIAVNVLGEDPPESPNCLQVLDATGSPVSTMSCGHEVSATLPSDGTYFARFGYSATVPTEYTFVIDPDPSLDTGPPPAVVLPPRPEPFEQDDAGSGRDAGIDAESAVAVARGVRYAATLRPRTNEGGVLDTGGDVDWFAFEAAAGETIAVAITNEHPSRFLPNCPTIVDANGELIADGRCRDEVVARIPADGTYYVTFGYFVAIPLDYEFVVEPPTDLFGTAYATAAKDMRPDPDQPTVVVAVGDTGVNPYHVAYHRPHLTEHPCTWVEGFEDCTIPALDLSIGVYDTYEEAYEADRHVWQDIEIGQWYWIPGTNIIGAACDGTTNAAGQPPPVSPQAPCIHDEDGHGTGTTSSVLSEAPNALLLVHEGNSGASALEHAPVVPDIRSHSWGPAAPLPLHAADPVMQELFGLGFASQGGFDPATLFFIAAGNEAPFPAIIDVNRVHPSIQIVGGGYPGRATARSWSTFDFASWMCRPTAVPRSTDRTRPSFCGTSFAAPTAAGTAAAALLELRRQEGYRGRSTADGVTPTVSRDDFVTALRRAATYTPEQRFENTGGELDLPEGQEHYFWGHGWLDAQRVATVVACARGEESCPTPNPAAQQWNDARQDLRRRQTSGVT